MAVKAKSIKLKAETNESKVKTDAIIEEDKKETSKLTKLSDLTLQDLLNYEKAVKLICITFEKSASAWGNDTMRLNYDNNSNLLHQYAEYKGIYDSIISEIKRRLKMIDYEK